MRTLFIVLVRPVGSSCWTTERIANTRAFAEKYALEERNRKIPFANGTLNIQSTCIVEVQVPSAPDSSQQHYHGTDLKP